MSSTSGMGFLMLNSEPTWQGIPYDVKEQIVQLLDYKSRSLLRICSKADRTLVESCPMPLEQLDLSLLSTQEVSRLSKLHIKYGSEDVELTKNIIEHFFGIFKTSSFTVKSVIFGFNPLDTNQSSQLIEKIESLAKSSKVRAERVYFRTNLASSEDFVKIFGIFSAQHLRSISLRQIVSPQLVEKLVEMDGWKCAKRIHLHGKQDIPMDSVLHMDMIRFALNNLTAEEAWKLVNAFIERENIEPGFGFRITYTCKLTEEQIAAEFKTTPCVVPNAVEHATQHKRSYHFATNTRGVVFVLRMRKSPFGCNDFEGYACTKGCDIDQEFRLYGSAASPDHIRVNRRNL